MDSLQRARESKFEIENPNFAITVIRPSRGWISLNLRDLWEYRELLYFLTWRDVKVRYKQTVLGAAWAIIEWKMEDGGWRMESIFPSPLSPFHRA